jgi:hypothetical protein
MREPMADERVDLSKQAVKNLSATRNSYVRALATDYSEDKLLERLEVLAKVQAAIDIIKTDLGPSR